MKKEYKKKIEKCKEQDHLAEYEKARAARTELLEDAASHGVTPSEDEIAEIRREWAPTADSGLRKSLPYQGIARRYIARKSILDKIKLLREELSLSVTDAKRAIAIILHGERLEDLQGYLAEDIEKCEELDVKLKGL